LIFFFFNLFFSYFFLGYLRVETTATSLTTEFVHIADENVYDTVTLTKSCTGKTLEACKTKTAQNTEFCAQVCAAAL
jgi:hypothetical protein